MKIRTTKQVDVDTIQTHPDNYNHGDAGAISVSLDELGQYRAIVVSEATGNIVAGNHTYLAAKMNGDSTILAHLIPDMTVEDEHRVLVGDNGLARLAYTDDNLLSELLTELVATDSGLSATGYDSDDLDTMLADLQGDTSGQDGEVVEPPDDPVTKLGDVWQLGPHTLTCGDALDAASYPKHAHMMFADPPYNVGIDYDDNTKDTKTEDEYRQWILDWWKAATPTFDRAIVTLGWHNWVWFASQVGHHAVGVWIKRNSTTHGRISMWNLWEPLMFIGDGWKKAGTQRNNDEFDFPMQHPNMKEDHPVPKPLNLIEELLTYYTHKGDTVVDPFGGSGTTLIAADNTDRRCDMIELSPAYCDVIVKRYEDKTGTVGHRL